MLIRSSNVSQLNANVIEYFIVPVSNTLSRRHHLALRPHHFRISPAKGNVDVSRDRGTYASKVAYPVSPRRIISMIVVFSLPCSALMEDRGYMYNSFRASLRATCARDREGERTSEGLGEYISTGALCTAWRRSRGLAEGGDEGGQGGYLQATYTY